MVFEQSFSKYLTGTQDPPTPSWQVPFQISIFLEPFPNFTFLYLQWDDTIIIVSFHCKYTKVKCFTFIKIYEKHCEFYRLLCKNTFSDVSLYWHQDQESTLCKMNFQNLIVVKRSNMHYAYASDPKMKVVKIYLLTSTGKIKYLN